MNEDVIFREMDLDGDGKLTRDEICHAAIHFGWQWQQASIYALLDLMAVRGPIDMEAFVKCMIDVSEDPDGPYGEVLRLVSKVENPAIPLPPSGDWREGDILWDGKGLERIVANLEHILSEVVAEDFKFALGKLEPVRPGVRTGETALLIVDPQRSFTAGSWKRSIGTNGDLEVIPIQTAFENCAGLLRGVYRRANVMFTRCPFPPDSYGWDERLEGIIDAGQPYFIKPGNSALHPASNGCREWLDGLLAGGVKRLVLGGCTLNSCLRISSMELLSAFRDQGLEVMVDLSLCGARASNFVNSSQFGGVSAVEAALQQMSGEGVKVCAGVEWILGN